MLGWKPQPTVFEIIFRDARFHSNVLSRGLKDLIFVPKGQYVVPFAEACCVQNRARHASANPTKAAIIPPPPCPEWGAPFRTRQKHAKKRQNFSIPAVTSAPLWHHKNRQKHDKSMTKNDEILPKTAGKHCERLRDMKKYFKNPSKTTNCNEV